MARSTGDGRDRTRCAGPRVRRRRTWARRSLVVAAALACGPLMVLSQAGVASASLPAGPSVVHVGQVPAIPHGAAAAGSLAAGAQLHLDVILRLEDPAGLAAYAQAVSDPGSPEYRQYLTPAEVAARFGPTEATVTAVAGALRAQGLSVGTVPANRLYLPVTATAAQAALAFRTAFRRYRLPTGRTAYANTAAPSLAAGVASQVRAVVGLNDLLRYQTHLIPSPRRSRPRTAQPRAAAPLPAGAGGPTACQAANQDAAAFGAYTTSQLARAYRYTGLYGAGDQGAGQTIALYELEPHAPSDIATYASCFGVTPHVTTLNIDGGPGSGPGSGESEVDIEVALGLAPRADVLVYQSPNGVVGPLDNYNAIVSQDRAQVISTSWGLCQPVALATEPGAILAEDTVFEEAATQGQSVVAAAGDNGAQDCARAYPTITGLNVDDPASQPYVTGVGGTDLTSLPRTSSQPPSEVVWNERAASLGAGGGGVAELWSKPAWQQGRGTAGVTSPSGPCGASGNELCRQVPDVSASADPVQGYAVYYDGAWTAFGGTSLATPLWASLASLTNEACPSRVGFLDPRLYATAAAHPSDFNDVTSGANDYTGTGNGRYPATAGYDMASGLGTPVATNGTSAGGGLAAALCGASTSPARPTVGRVSPATGKAAGGDLVTVTGTNLTGATAVTFGTEAVTTGITVAASGTSLTVTSPAVNGNPSTVDVTVTTPAGTSAPDPAARFRYVSGSGPVVETVTTGGPLAGKTPVTVKGYGLSGATQVSVGSAALGAGQFRVANDATITFTSPPASAAGAPDGGPVPVTVTVAGVTSSAGTPFQDFLYTPVPTVTSVTPGAGPPTGGATVTITGTGFGAYCFDYTTTPPAAAPCATSPYGVALVQNITFGSGPASKTVNGEFATFVNDTTLTVAAPPGVGREPITVTDNFGQSSPPAAPAHFTYEQLPPPTVTALDPPVGTTSGGTPVHVTGTGFTSGMQVSFNGVAASGVTVTSPTSATVTSPPGPSGTVHVDVTTPWGTTTATDTLTSPNRFLYVSTPVTAPAVLALSPDAGPPAGGTRVTITGANLGAATGVSFGNAAVAGPITGIPAGTSITVTSPRHAAGPVEVRVTSAGAGASVPRPQYDTFTYTNRPSVSGLAPGTGPTSGGTRVTITGINLQGAGAAHFGGVAAAVVCASAASCTAVAPAHAAGAVPVTVTTPSGMSAAGAASRFTYLAVPSEGRISGRDRAATAVAVALAQYPGGPPIHTAILVVGSDGHLVDGLAATPLARALGDPVLLADSPAAVGPTTSRGLAALHVGRVVLVGAAGHLAGHLPAGVVVAANYEGADRYATAGLVDKALQRAEGGTKFTTAFITSGSEAHLVDALAAGPAAGRQGEPVVLVPDPVGGRTAVPAAELAYLAGVTTAFQIGVVGPARVTNLPGGAVPVEVTGTDRFATAALIDVTFFPSPPVLLVADGLPAHMVDALAAGPYAASLGAPVALTADGPAPGATEGYLDMLAPGTPASILAGPGSVSDAAAASVRGQIGPP